MKCIIISLCICVYFAAAKNIFVSPFGSDQNPGTTATQPLAHVARAVAMAQNGDSILLEPGTFSGALNCIAINIPLDIRSSNTRKPATFDCGTSDCITLNAAGKVENVFFEMCNHGIVLNAPNATFHIRAVKFNQCNVAVNASSFDYLNVSNVVVNYAASYAIYAPGSLVSTKMSNIYITNAVIHGGSRYHMYFGNYINAQVERSILMEGIRGILCDQGSKCMLTSVSVEESASYGMAFYSATVAMDQCVVRMSGGSGIYSNNSVVGISNTMINSNFASGLSVNDGTVKLYNVLIHGNNANSNDGYGGGFYIQGGEIAIQNSIISNNTAYDGGGFYCVGSSSISIMNSILRGNKAFYGGDYDCKRGAACSPNLVNVTDVNNVSILGPCSCTSNENKES